MSNLKTIGPSAFYKTFEPPEAKTRWDKRMVLIGLIWGIIFIIGVGARTTHLFQALDTELWREDDMATIAKNFYQNNTNIFHPQIAWDGSGPGYTESEFQIYTYLIAVSYKICGFSEHTGRVISFLFSLATMLVFFRLSRYLFSTKAAIAASFFFALSPMLLLISNSVRPEPVMLFFYICSAYAFIRWLDSSSNKHYLLAILSTALALLCKIPAANIGLFFILAIIVKRNWKFLFTRKVLILGALSIIPSILWYSYCHRFYTLYGNSLGLSNEYAWIGWDFFTTSYFVKGIIKNELNNVWTLSGPVIVILALLFTKLLKREGALLAICWFGSAFVFYFLAARATAEEWAYYYHIFSIPAVSLLLGASVIELYDKYFPGLRGRSLRGPSIVKSTAIIFSLILLVSYFVVSSAKYLALSKKPNEFQTSNFYVCKDTLMKIIPEKSLLLANGATRGSLRYPHAYNNSYFFYWLDRKGYNIPVEDLSINGVLSFRAKGVAYFLAEERVLQLKPGFEDELKRNFKKLFERNGCILFKL